MTLESPQHRLRAWAGAWNVTIERTLETESSVIGVGRRGARGVVLKVVKTPGDEWHSGAVVRAFDGRGVVQVDEFEDGALLLERLSPGDSLADLASAGDDEAATAIVADVIQRMHAPSAPRGCPHVMDWCAGFDRYLRSGDQRLPHSLVARRTHAASPRSRRRSAARGCCTVIFSTTTSCSTRTEDGWRSIPRVSSVKSSTRSGQCCGIRPKVQTSSHRRQPSRGASVNCQDCWVSIPDVRSSGDTFKPCCQRSGASKMGTRSLRTALCSGWPTSSAR